MGRLVIYGAGGFGREVWALTRDRFSSIAFCDDSKPSPWAEVPCIDQSEITPDDEVYIAIAETDGRQRVAERLKGVRFASLYAPTAVIAPDVVIGEGAFFCHFTHAAVSARIGKQALVHVYAYVGHENIIGDFVTVGPRASLNGNVTVEDGAYIGAGAMVRQGLRIGAGAVIGMGAVVVRDVLPGQVVAGNPARVLIPRAVAA